MGYRHVVVRRRLLPILLLLPLITTCVSDREPLAVAGHSKSLQSHFVANLLTDPGFEAGGQDWHNSSASGRVVDAQRMHDGAAAQRITASALQELAVYQERAVIAESSYTASGWIATDALDGSHAVLEVLWLTVPGLGDSIPPGELLGSDLVGALESTTDWTLVARSVTVPCVRLRGSVEVGTGATTSNGPGSMTTRLRAKLGRFCPWVRIDSPAGSTIGGVVTITATATDEGPVARLQFQVNGVNLGTELTSAPYQTQLDTHTLPNGPADLTAIAWDTAGNDTVSDPVRVTVFNPPPPAMNIVFILSDDQRANTMAQMPLTRSLIGTPGVQFVNAFSTTPLCCPARATTLTGLYTHNHHVISNAAPYGAPVFADGSTIATWLQAAGYRTALIGKYLNLYDQKKPWPYQPPGWSYWSAFKVPNYYNYRLVENRKEVPYGSTRELFYSCSARRGAFIDLTPPRHSFFCIFTIRAPHSSHPGLGQTSWYLPGWHPAPNGEDDGDNSLIRKLPY